MAIFRVGTNTGAGGSAVGIPYHAAGDVVLVFAAREGGGSGAVGAPAGFTEIGTQRTSGSLRDRAFYVVSAGTNEAGGAMDSVSVSSSDNICVAVYRGTKVGAPIGAAGSTGATGGSVLTFPALSLGTTNGSSWVVGWAAHRSTDTSMSVAPSGMVNQRDFLNGSTNRSAIHDTNGGVASWSSQTANVGGTSSDWSTRVIEIQAEPNAYSLTANKGTFTVSGKAAGVVRSRTVQAAVRAFSVTGQPAGLAASRVLPGAAGAFTTSTPGVALKADRVFGAAPGAYAFTGYSADFILPSTYIFDLAAAGFTAGYLPADLRVGRVLSADPVAFGVQPIDADLRATRVLTPNLRTYAVNSEESSYLLYGRRPALLTGAFTVSGAPVALERTFYFPSPYRINVPAGPYSISAPVPLLSVDVPE